MLLDLPIIFDFSRLVGSSYAKENAEFIVAQLRAWGYDAQFETFDVLFPQPKTLTFTRITVMPISYADVLPLLRNLGGAVAPQFNK
jgi:hypothetical protein